jgi:hypothetical protein
VFCFKIFDVLPIAIQQQNLTILKQLQLLNPISKQSNIPDFISIQDACQKYHVSHVTINNKIKLFKVINNTCIDRLRLGEYFLINEHELQQALRLKGTYRKVIPNPNIF